MINTWISLTSGVVSAISGFLTSSNVIPYFGVVVVGLCFVWIKELMT